MGNDWLERAIEELSLLDAIGPDAVADAIAAVALRSASAYALVDIAQSLRKLAGR